MAAVKKTKMTDDDLKATLDAHIQNSMGYISGDLSDQRMKAMEYYLGEPFGNEVDGRSKVVSTDVADTIEWILPSLMRTFTATDEAVRFDPVSEEDIPAAEQETDYINYVFYKDNPGFIILYTWIKDALLQKNGIVKTFWEKTTHETRESYEGLTDDEFLQLSQDPELEPIEHTARQVPMPALPTPEMAPMPGQPPQAPAQPQMMIVHDVAFKRTSIKGKAKIINIAPEDFGISKSYPLIDVKDAPFVYHRSDQTASDLLEMGIDKATVDSLPYSTESDTGEKISRDNLNEEANNKADDAASDTSMRKIRVYECYVRLDYDGDGIAELMKITKAGNEILTKEEVDSIPFDIITPVILPHKHFGLSIADLVMDLQLIKSTIWRQMLDNMYLTNNSRTAVNKNLVNLDDLLTSRPGGVVRCDGDPGMALAPIVTQPLSPTSYQMIEYIDRVREGRSGVSQTTMGLNDNLLSNNKGDPTVARVMTAAEQRIELVARIFAETGIKSLFLRLHELLLKHQDKERVIKLRNKWVPVKPTEWRERTDMTVNVGLGTGERQALAQSMMGLMNIQKAMIENGGLGVTVSLKNIYQTAIDFSKYSGIKNADNYFTSPDSPESQQTIQQKNQDAQEAKQNDPNRLFVQVEAQKNQVTAQKNDLEHQRAMIELQFEKQRLEQDFQQKVADIQEKSKKQVDDIAVRLTELELKYAVNVPGSVV
jgi:hypothetical protein